MLYNYSYLHLGPIFFKCIRSCPHFILVQYVFFNLIQPWFFSGFTISPPNKNFILEIQVTYLCRRISAETFPSSRILFPMFLLLFESFSTILSPRELFYSSTISHLDLGSRRAQFSWLDPLLSSQELVAIPVRGLSQPFVAMIHGTHCESYPNIQAILIDMQLARFFL